MKVNQEKHDKLSLKRLNELLTYDPETGNFLWKSNRGGTAYIGSIAGAVNARGYVMICILRNHYLAHRLAWFITHGNWPSDQIDHINGDRSDNKISNLRAATNSQNMINTKLKVTNKSGHAGLYYYEKGKQWRASVTINGKQTIVGQYQCKNKAIAKLKKARKEVYGEFLRKEASHEC